MMRLPTLVVLLAAIALPSNAFVTAPISNNNRNGVGTQLFFGIPGFLTPKDNNSDDSSDDSKEVKDKKIGMAGMVQLITAGMGAPFLGDYQGVDDDGKFMFSLEANNLVDEEGNSKQTQMPYFESGWVDPADEEKARQNEGFKFPWQN